MEDRTMIVPCLSGQSVPDAAWAPQTPYQQPGGGWGDTTQHALSTTCPVCQTPNPPSERFCQDCGFMFGSAAGEIEALPDLSQLPRLVDNTGREFALDSGPNSVGRESADVLLADPTISRSHAQITVESGQIVVEDRGSTNGSYVRAVRLKPGERATAYDGDAVRFGNLIFTLKLPGGAPAPVSAAAAAEPAVAPVAEDRGAAVGTLQMADGTEHPLYAGVNSLGRRSGNQIVVPDAFMSGRHAEVRIGEDGAAVLVDIGSTNGTFFEGRRLAHHEEIPLVDGAAFTMGKSPATFRAIGSAGPSPGYAVTEMLSAAELAGAPAAAPGDGDA